MARDVVVTSDKTGKPGALTYTLRVDPTGETWEVDLLEEEATFLKVFRQHGRQKGSAPAGRGGPRGMESRVRNLPKKARGS